MFGPYRCLHGSPNARLSHYFSTLKNVHGDVECWQSMTMSLYDKGLTNIECDLFRASILGILFVDLLGKI